MSELNTSNADRAIAQNIQKQYLSREENKIEELKRLDGKVKAPGKIISSILGIIGALTLGAGMSFIMVWNNMLPGLILGIPGLIVLLLIYPVYKMITGNRKKKYADEIIKLSDSLIKTDREG